MSSRRPGAALTYVRPTFMLPAVGMSVFGSLLAGVVRIMPAVLHALAVGVALFVAHLNDGYVDGHLRDEEPPVLPARTNRRVTAASSLAFFAIGGALWVAVGAGVVVATVPLWVLAVLHAPYLDTHPVTVTIDYPVGIGLAILGGVLTQTVTIPPVALGVALVFVVALSGIKVSIDRLDLAFDRSVDKRTVPVVLGDRTAAAIAAGLLLSAGALVGGLVVLGTVPAFGAAAAVFPALAAVAAVAAPKLTGVRLQMLLTYPFALVLFAAGCDTLSCGLWP